MGTGGSTYESACTCSQVLKRKGLPAGQIRGSENGEATWEHVEVSLSLYFLSEEELDLLGETIVQEVLNKIMEGSKWVQFRDTIEGR